MTKRVVSFPLLLWMVKLSNILSKYAFILFCISAVVPVLVMMYILLLSMKYHLSSPSFIMFTGEKPLTFAGISCQIQNSLNRIYFWEIVPCSKTVSWLFWYFNDSQNIRNCIQYLQSQVFIIWVWIEEGFETGEQNCELCHLNLLWAWINSSSFWYNLPRCTFLLKLCI